MFAELIDRRAQKLQCRACLKHVQVSAVGFTLLYLALYTLLDVVDTVAQGPAGSEQSLIGLFASVLTGLIGVVLYAGFVLYCMAVRKNERVEYASLFDGFSMAGKIIVLSVIMFGFIVLWSMLLIVPGVIAAYRYRFALYNLLENPELTPLEALNLSKRQTVGYKVQLLLFDLSYIGWTLLSGLPMTVYASYVSAQMAGTILSGSGVGAVYAAVSPGLPLVILSSVWAIAVQLFYLPQMTCAELGYFAAAKRSSGLGVDNGPSDFDPPTISVPGPHDMDNNYGGGYKDEF